MTTYATVEAKWAASTKGTKGGHLLWTGKLNSHSGTPVIDLRGRRYQAARVAFRILNGREPKGAVRVTCGKPLCVAHVSDTADRLSSRAFQRALIGRDVGTGTCRAGHDRAIHGRLRNDGRPYCNACNQTYRRRSSAQKTSTSA